MLGKFWWVEVFKIDGVFWLFFIFGEIGINFCVDVLENNIVDSCKVKYDFLLLVFLFRSLLEGVVCVWFFNII